MNLFLLAMTVGDISRGSTKNVKVSAFGESGTTSLIIVQRESLAYSIEFARWLAGDVPRRDVQIARASLSQRLNVTSSEGVVTGQKLTGGYHRALAISDKILTNSQPGYLNASDSLTIKTESALFLNLMLSESRNITLLYQQGLEPLSSALDEHNRDEVGRNLFILSLLVLLLIILFTPLITIPKGQYKKSAA